MSISNEVDPTLGQRPATPRWRVHVENEGDAAAILRFRAAVHERLLRQPPWRAAVVTAEIGLVAVTFSVFGDDYDTAMSDAKSVLIEFGVPDDGLSIEIVSPEQLARRRSSKLPLLLGVKEVAELLGYSKQRVSQLAREPGTFPAPVSRVEATPLWLREEIEEWQDRNYERVDDRLARKKERLSTRPSSRTSRRADN